MLDKCNFFFYHYFNYPPLTRLTISSNLVAQVNVPKPTLNLLMLKRRKIVIFHNCLEFPFSLFKIQFNRNSFWCSLESLFNVIKSPLTLHRFHDTKIYYIVDVLSIIIQSEGALRFISMLDTILRCT